MLAAELLEAMGESVVEEVPVTLSAEEAGPGAEELLPTQAQKQSCNPKDQNRPSGSEMSG